MLSTGDVTIVYDEIDSGFWGDDSGRADLLP